MKTVSFVFVLIFGFAHSSGDYYAEHTDSGFRPIHPVHQIHHDTDEHGFSAGSGLRSIAQGSASRAHSAVINQHVAAHQAAYVAQSSLAQEAIQAAATANAALAGKEVLLRGLERQAADAHHALDSELKHLELTSRASLSAKQAADSATNHISVLAAALNNANSAAEHAQEAAEQTAAEHASQTAMVGKAKERLTSITSRLHAAQIDFQATKEAADKASAAAHEAQENASHAGLYASHKLLEEAGSLSHEGDIVSAAPHNAATYEVQDHGHYRHRH